MFTEKFTNVMKREGVVAIVTWADNDAHVANTWNSYLRRSGENKLLIPAFGMHKTEQNLEANPRVLVTLGSKEVEGLNGMGTGFLITGTARFVATGSEVEKTKKEFGWANRVLEITMDSIEQTV